MASFLNTAAMCYLYVGMVLRNKTGRSRNKISIACISQNLILPIMSPIVTFRLEACTNREHFFANNGELSNLQMLIGLLLLFDSILAHQSAADCCCM
jgi:hypothetical protein